MTAKGPGSSGPETRAPACHDFSSEKSILRLSFSAWRPPSHLEGAQAQAALMPILTAGFPLASSDA